jgi:hypothetical protein
MAQTSLFISYRCETNYFLVYLRITFHSSVVITYQVRPLSQALNNELMALCPAIDILDIISRGLEVAGRVVALGDKDVIIHTALKRLIQGNWRTLKLSADLEGG